MLCAFVNIEYIYAFKVCIQELLLQCSSLYNIVCVCVQGLYSRTPVAMLISLHVCTCMCLVFVGEGVYCVDVCH